MSFNEDMSKSAVMKRFEQANLMAITTHSGVVFKSLQDILDLLKELDVLKQQLQEKDEIIGNLLTDRK